MVRPSHQLIRTQCQLFITEQAKASCLTQTQFRTVYRILSKAKHFADLAKLVKAILLNQVTLYERTEGNDNLTECKLDCSYRLKLAKQSI